MFRRSRVSLAAALAVGGVAMLATSGVIAQDSGQRVEVTGSRIKRTDAETASPVQIITREDIERTGKTSIQDVLRGVTADSKARSRPRSPNGFASGSAAISLRGLGVNSTLVLVNGRRMTTYGLADDGVRTFVDLNSIPLEAVERVEVLKDGASAIYGADAVGGVVNIILQQELHRRLDRRLVRPDRQERWPDDARVRLDRLRQHRHRQVQRLRTIEASKQKNIWSKDRGFIGETDLRSLDYYDLTNGATASATSGPHASGTLTLRCDRRSADLPGARAAGQRHSLRRQLESTRTTGLCRYNTSRRARGAASDRPAQFLRSGHAAVLAVAHGLPGAGLLQHQDEGQRHAGRQQRRRRLQPGGPGQSARRSRPDDPSGRRIPTTRSAGRPGAALRCRTNSAGATRRPTTRCSVSFRASRAPAFGWDFDIGALYVKSQLKNENIGFIRYDVMQAALNNGTLPFPDQLDGPSPTDPAVLAAISPTLENNPTSSVKAIDLKVSRDLASLPGGPLGLALGGEVRWEAANSPPVPFTDTAEIVGLGYSAFSQKRRVRGGLRRTERAGDQVARAQRRAAV